MHYSNILEQLHKKVAIDIDFLLKEIADMVAGFPDKREMSGADRTAIAEAEALFDSLLEGVKPAFQNGDFATDPDTPDAAQTHSEQVVPASVAQEAIVYDHPTPSRRTAIKHKLAMSSLRGRHANKLKPVTCKFENLSASDRHDAIHLYVSLSEALAFSLHFDQVHLSRLQASGDPVRCLSDAINRLARKVFGSTVPMTFVFEFSEAGTLHVHGAAILQHSDKEVRVTFRQVLKRAAGVIHGEAAAFQLETKPLRDLHWNRYCEKDMSRTRDLLGTDKISFVSRELLTGARAYHDHRRALHKAARGRQSPQ